MGLLNTVASWERMHIETGGGDLCNVNPEPKRKRTVNSATHLEGLHRY